MKLGEGVAFHHWWHWVCLAARLCLIFLPTLLASFSFHPWCQTVGSTSFVFQPAVCSLLQDLGANTSSAWNALAHFSIRSFPFLQAQIVASYWGCPWLAICDISPFLWASHIFISWFSPLSFSFFLGGGGWSMSNYLSYISCFVDPCPSHSWIHPIYFS